jgi:cell wall-associated NlpC family hydrolase
MPINRLTVFSVLAAAMLVVVPAQAATSKTHSKTTHAKQTQQKQTHGKVVAHSKPAHGKLAKSTHKATHSKQAVSSSSLADVAIPATAITVAAVEMKPLLPAAGSLQTKSFVLADSSDAVTAQTMNQLPMLDPAPVLAQSIIPADIAALAVVTGNAVSNNVATTDSAAADQVDADEEAPAAAADAGSVTDLRKALIGLAMNLREIRYVRGGHDPSTGFDCSGFVRYVFAHAIGLQLPTNSASQFLAGLKVNRADMKPGDLVFFRTHGKRNISHVGIYISDGRFIHSPATGKSVEISSLNEVYWAKRFAGAKRPEGIAQVQVASKG